MKVGRDENRMKSITACWIIAPKIWFSIFSSWGISAVMLIDGFKFSLIGPAFICGSLIAEVFFTRLEWRKLLRARPKKQKPKEWIGWRPESEELFFETFEKKEPIDISYNKFLYALQGLDKGVISSANPALSVGNNTMAWIYDLDVRYAENSLQVWILLNVVVGTIIWGYGDFISEWIILIVWIIS